MILETNLKEEIKMGVLQDEVHSINYMLPQLINPIINSNQTKPIPIVEDKTDQQYQNSVKALEVTTPWALRDSQKPGYYYLFY
jgi:hypothetical protein